MSQSDSLGTTKHYLEFINNLTFGGYKRFQEFLEMEWFKKEIWVAKVFKVFGFNGNIHALDSWRKSWSLKNVILLIIGNIV